MLVCRDTCKVQRTHIWIGLLYSPALWLSLPPHLNINSPPLWTRLVSLQRYFKTAIEKDKIESPGGGGRKRDKIVETNGQTSMVKFGMFC